jgi:hypothetical protein
MVGQLHEVSAIQHQRHYPLHQGVGRTGVQATCFRAVEVGDSCLEGYYFFHQHSFFVERSCSSPAECLVEGLVARLAEDLVEGSAEEPVAMGVQFRWVDIGFSRCRGYRTD